jgi:YjbE family integral membrane protein
LDSGVLTGTTSAQFFVDLLRIMSIDILLSGDNAVVIALASRSLPDAQRWRAVVGGSAAAVVMRILLCLIITTVLNVPYLKVGGGMMLLYIGVKLVLPEGETDVSDVAPTSHVWRAIRTILIADAVMSLDNVVAIAAAAHGSAILIALGLIISIPLIVFGSQIVLKILNRMPMLVVLGAGLLGWIAGELIVSDSAIHRFLPYDEHATAVVAKPALALLVMTLGTVLARRTKAKRATIVDLAPEDMR